MALVFMAAALFPLNLLLSFFAFHDRTIYTIESLPVDEPGKTDGGNL
jgi:hypothetical protein